jgi:hypothetical protein
LVATTPVGKGQPAPTPGRGQFTPAQAERNQGFLNTLTARMNAADPAKAVTATDVAQDVVRSPGRQVHGTNQAITDLAARRGVDLYGLVNNRALQTELAANPRTAGIPRLERNGMLRGLRKMDPRVAEVVQLTGLAPGVEWSTRWRLDPRRLIGGEVTRPFVSGPTAAATGWRLRTSRWSPLNPLSPLSALTAATVLGRHYGTNATKDPVEAAFNLPTDALDPTLWRSKK